MTALHQTGGIISGASPAYNVEEMTYALRTARAKILMTAESSLAIAIPAAEQAGISKDRIILLDGHREGFSTIKDLVELGKTYGIDGQILPFQIPLRQTNKDICGYLSFSSGTTGLPKAVSYRSISFYRKLIRIFGIGHDLASQRHCAMSTSSTNHTLRS